MSRTDEPNTPPWVSVMKVGHWYRISGDHPDLGLPLTPVGTRYLKDHDPADSAHINPARGIEVRLRRLAGRYVNAPWSGRNGFRSITEGWNGAVLATRFGSCGSVIVFGGGHNNYFGSDVHAFDLGTRQWARISDGYVSGQPNEYGAGAVYPESIYPDGSPLPPHTYEYVQYDPVGNDYLLFKGQSELGPEVKATPIPHMFNMDTLTWRRGPIHPSAILNSGGWTTWDAPRRVLWGNSGDFGGGNAYIGFSPDGDNGDGTFGAWGPLYPNKCPGNANHNAMQIDPQRDIIVVLVNARNTLYAINPADPAAPIKPLASSGQQPQIREYAAIEYAPNLDKLVYYSGYHGSNIYSITAPRGSTWAQLTGGRWVWQGLCAETNDLDPAADAQAASAYKAHQGHTFGRFRLASFKMVDIAILVRHIDSPVYAMRLS